VVPEGEEIDFSFQVNKKKITDAKKKLQGYTLMGTDRKKGALTK